MNANGLGKGGLCFVESLELAQSCREVSITIAAIVPVEGHQIMLVLWWVRQIRGQLPVYGNRLLVIRNCSLPIACLPLVLGEIIFGAGQTSIVARLRRRTFDECFLESYGPSTKA